MAVKNFVFRENWVGSKVAGMETIFLPFLTQPGPTFWPRKAQINNLFRSILVKKDSEIKTVTKVKFLKIMSFLPFLTQIGQKFDPNVLLM